MEAIINQSAHVLTLAIEAAAILVIAGGLIAAFGHAIIKGRKLRDWRHQYEEVRRSVGRTLLLGLEFLLAAEIVRSIMLGEALVAVLTLGIIVVIRTFLSIAIDMEINRRWPWQDGDEERQE